MNKKEIISSVSEIYDMHQGDVKEVFEAIFETITENLMNGEKVDIYGFGSFIIVERAARKGRNPATGESIDIAESKGIKFKPSKNLKDGIKN